MIIPLTAKGRGLGALTLVARERRYTEDELAAAEDLARRCAMAIENARLYEQAQDALKVRDQFLAVAAHELRSPLTRLKSYTEVLLELVGGGQASVGQLVQSLHRMNVAIDRLSVLMTDLLEVSRLQRRLPLRFQSLDFCDMLRRVVAEHVLLSDERHRVTLDLAAGPCWLTADPDRLTQVLSNLLDNAIKYSPTGGTIYVSLEIAEGGPLVRVRDEGIGLPSGAAERMFEPFNRAVNALAGNIPGLGLGLHISRQIVLRHGGRIWAESPGEGQGTTICVWLPWTRRPRRRLKGSAGSRTGAVPK
jgi:signal transduction histidine kinase